MSQWIIDRLVALERRISELEQAQKKDQPPERAARLPADWQPRPEDLAWAQEKYPHVNETNERERFIDYWKSRGESRRDWHAAYRNWIRKASDISAPRQSGVPARSDSRAAALAASNRDKRNRLADELAQVQPRRT